MEALIPAPADYELWSVQSIAQIEIHHIGLEFGEFRVQIPVLTKLIGVLFVFPSVIKTNAVLDLHYRHPFSRYS